MAIIRGTYGELMDAVSQFGDDGAKELLRKCFQGWCEQNNKPMFDAQTVMEWRALPFSTDTATLAISEKMLGA